MTKPLRVLVLTYIYTNGDPRYGGEGRVVWETTQALARAGVKVFVVTSMKSLTATPHPNITLYQIPFAKKNFLNFDSGELLKMFFFCIPLLFVHRIDIIHHLPTNGPDPFARFKFGKIFAESADSGWDYENPKVGKELKYDRAHKMQEAGYTAPQGFDFWLRAARRIFGWIGVNQQYPAGVDIFFYRQRSLGEPLKKLRPESEGMYVPNGVDPKEFFPQNEPLFPRTRSGVRFLNVGSISRRKGIHYLVDGFIEVVKEYPESELVLVGRGQADFVDELKAKAAPYPQIQFHSDVSNQDLPRAYVSADIFCLVVLSGGSTPTVLSEALASGLPIIATKESGSGDSVTEYDAGYLVEPGDAADIARAMRYAIEHPEETNAKAAHALAASKFFTWDYIAACLIEGYTKTLESRTAKKR